MASLFFRQFFFLFLLREQIALAVAAEHRDRTEKRFFVWIYEFLIVTTTVKTIRRHLVGALLLASHLGENKN